MAEQVRKTLAEEAKKEIEKDPRMFKKLSYK